MATLSVHPSLRCMATATRHIIELTVDNIPS